MRLFDHQLVVVTGKGGVGRTTTTAALGRAAARMGRRTLVVELSGQSSLARACGFREAAYAPREVEPNLWVASLTHTDCLADFGQTKLRLPALARWFFESRLMTGFVESVPGLVDLVQLGKLEHMVREPKSSDPTYDLAIVDAPATGHGLTLLASARAMREMTGVGPFHDLSLNVERFLEDERTGFVLVTLPEALPVNESLELVRALSTEHTPPSLVLVNQVVDAWPGRVKPEVVLSALEGPDAARTALRDVARRVLARHARQNLVIGDLAARLPEAAGRPAAILRLPRLDDPTELGPMAERLVGAFGGRP